MLANHYRVRSVTGFGLNAIAIVGAMAIAVLATSAYSNAAEIGYVDGDGDIQKPFDVFWVERLQSQGHNVTPLPVNYDPTGPEAANLDIFIVSADIGSGDFIQGVGVVPQVVSVAWQRA